ncbi:hypothetical protein ACO0QE_003193 [Hanseniaspora vineae]
MTAEPSRKKFKVSSPDYSEFAKGAIVKIRLENFVIYKLTEFNLSPSLNMIIGPNGSGKSTFVCAVCLGLAGRPEYIGRAKKVEDFVRNNTKSCKISIFLKNNYEALSQNTKLRNYIPKNQDIIEVTRIIYKNPIAAVNSSTRYNSTKNLEKAKKSDYFINNKSCSETLVKELVSLLNIQLDNLCQFLSQERVEEFAKLKSEKLLTETIRSIQPDLIPVFESLQDNEVLKLDKSKQLENQKKMLETSTAKRDELKGKVEELQNYREKIKEIELHKKLIPIVKIKDFDKSRQKLKQELKTIKNHYIELTKKAEPFQAALQELTNDYKKSQTAYKDSEKEVSALNNDLNRKIKNIKKVVSKIDENKKKIQYYQKRNETCLHQIEAEKAKKETLQAQLSNLNSPDQAEFDKLHEQRKQKTIAKNNKIAECETLNDEKMSVSSKLSKERQVIQQRQSSLQSNDPIYILDTQRFKPEIKSAVLFLRENAEDINSTILPPPIMSVSATNVAYSRFLNAVVDRNVAIAFTITSDSTYHRYSSMLLDKWGLNIRQLSSEPVSQPYIDSKTLQQEWGFDGYLLDFVKGESAVIQMLCEQSRIQQIPVSVKPLTNSIVERLKNFKDQKGNLIFQRVLAGNTMYNFRQSKYGDRQIFYTSSNIFQNNTLYQGNVISEEYKNKILEFIQARTANVKEYEQKLQDLKEQERSIKNEIESFVEEVDRVVQEEVRLKQQGKEYRRVQAYIEKSDSNIAHFTEQLKKDVSSKTQQLLFDNIALSETLCQQNEEMLQFNIKVDEMNARMLEQKIVIFDKKNKFKHKEDEYEGLNKELEEMDKLYREKADEYKEYKKNDRVLQWKSEIRKYSEDLLLKLKSLSDHYQDIQKFDTKSIREEIENLEDDIKNSNHDDSVLNILETTEEKIKALEMDIPKAEQEILELQEKMTSDHEFLKPKLENMVSKISARFGKLFPNVGSEGAVELDTRRAYKDWNLKIMVAFRDNDKLSALDSHTQSGGERAVSTVLYMIALQEFTTAPFRVVDEINQGMDSNNERIVHKAMVTNACAEKTSQYFLITPKLLTDLHYDPKMRIHCVMAGAWIPNPSEDQEKVHFGQTSNYVF